MGVPNPRTVDAALDWQLRRSGSTAWEGWSWKFQRLAYGYPQDGHPAEAAAALSWFRTHDRINDGDPPRGALAWFQPPDAPAEAPDSPAPADSPAPVGSDCPVIVRCALGDGRVVGPSVDGGIGVADARRMPGFVGWTEPYFPFALT